MRVGIVVINDKTGINGVAACAQLHIKGGGMAADAVGGFKELNVMAELHQTVRAAKPGDARANNCCFQICPRKVRNLFAFLPYAWAIVPDQERSCLILAIFGVVVAHCFVNDWGQGH